MAAHFKGLTDRRGMPIERQILTEEIDAPSITGVRSPLTSYPGDGLDPSRLAAILREADCGDPVRYLELAETIEERDLHYAGVLATRKRSVSQLDVTVDAASEDPAHRMHADTITAWLKRDELADELFDMLDAVGKGYSFTEIIWDSSEGQWSVDRLEWRDPRWYRFDRIDGATPLRLDDHGQELPLPAFKYICPRIRAKSGLPVRSGIARIATWAWLFKAFTQRDWAIFTQTYGQPVRLGKYGPGATEQDRDTLFRAVANIAADCAAIIPESMMIEFVEAKNLGTGHANYKDRCDWLDRQVSKGVLGQTATTDAIAGGHAVGKEHREVQGDIERADCRQMNACINRDLVRPWIMLEFGPQEVYPRVRIGRAEETDVKLAVESVERLVPLGLRVGRKQMSDLIGIGEPDDDDELLTPAPAPAMPEPQNESEPDEPEAGALDEDKPHAAGAAGREIAANAAAHGDAIDAAVERILADDDGTIAQALTDGLEGKIAAARSLDDIPAILAAHMETIEVEALREPLARLMFAARLAGVTEERI